MAAVILRVAIAGVRLALRLLRSRFGFADGPPHDVRMHRCTFLGREGGKGGGLSSCLLSFYDY